jgi:hypothetical protein
MDESDPVEPPSESWVDLHHELMIEAANALTVGLGGTLLAKVFPSKATKRRQAFDADVKDRLDRLEEQGRITRQMVEDNEQFFSTYLHATLIAVRSHQSEKLEALRNAVLNSALPCAPDENRQQIFLNWVDELTPLHLRVLNYLLPAREYSKRLPDAIADAFPESKAVDLANVIVDDLAAKHLIRSDPTNGVVYLGVKETRLTPLGSAFLSFIRDPMN